MLSYIKKAVSGQPTVDPRDTLVQDEFAKQQLKKHLIVCIKKLQLEHLDGNKSIERNDESAHWLCTIFEAIFLHGYIEKVKVQPLKRFFEEDKDNNKHDQCTIAFWDVLQNLTHKNIITELRDLSVTTDVGLCRAWVRLALNDHLMESYLDSILADQQTMLSFYSPNAFLVDKELIGISKELLQGTAEFEFRLNYNSPKLNSWERRTLFLAGCFKASEAKEEQEWSESVIRRASIRNSFTASLPISPSTSYPDAPNFLQNERQSRMFDGIEELQEDNTSPPQSTLLNEMECESPVINPNIQSGNKLNGSVTPWSGWSSAFNDYEDASTINADTLDTSLSPNKDDATIRGSSVIPDPSYESFGALLSNYGENSQPDNPMCQYDPVSNPIASSKEKSLVASQSRQKSLDSNMDELNFEVIPPNAVSHPDTHTQFLLSNLIQVPHECGLDKQSFQCNGCGKSIGLIYGTYRICHFDARYYCFDCHDNEEHVIPGRILQNWDFKLYPVSRANAIFLMKNEEEPMFNLDEVNPTLYNSVLALSEMKMIRIQTQHVKGYLSTCRKEVAEEFRRRIWPREYLCEDIHQYSILDLIQVSTGQLANHLRKIVFHFTKHIYKCSLCSQKGFVCEICKDPNIIYPFEVHSTAQCNKCLSLFHKQCRKDRGRCPKCSRLRLRTRSSLLLGSNS